MGTDMVIDLVIPEIHTVVIYTHSSLSITLPYELFSGNTEGQCGEFIRICRNIGCKKQYKGSHSNSVCLIMCYLYYQSQHGCSCFVTLHLFLQEPVTTRSQMTVALQMVSWNPAKTLQTSGQFLEYPALLQRFQLLQQPLKPQACSTRPAILWSVKFSLAGESRGIQNALCFMFQYFLNLKMIILIHVVGEMSIHSLISSDFL